MRLSEIRALLFGCIGLMLVAFSFAAPAAATERIDAGYHVLIQEPSALIASEMPAILVDRRQEAQAVALRSSSGAVPISQIYRLSALTNGQIFSGHHMRC